MREFAMGSSRWGVRDVEFAMREFAMREFAMREFAMREFAMREFAMREFAMGRCIIVLICAALRLLVRRAKVYLRCNADARSPKSCARAQGLTAAARGHICASEQERIPLPNLAPLNRDA